MDLLRVPSAQSSALRPDVRARPHGRGFV